MNALALLFVERLLNRKKWRKGSESFAPVSGTPVSSFSRCDTGWTPTGGFPGTTENDFRECGKNNRVRTGSQAPAWKPNYSRKLRLPANRMNR